MNGMRLENELAGEGRSGASDGLTPQRWGSAVSMNRDSKVKAGGFSKREGGRLGCCAPPFSRPGGKVSC